MNKSPENILLPELGESITEAKILKIHKKVGDSVHKNEVIIEVATDKVDSEIDSPIEGTIIHIAYKENDMVPVGATLMQVATDKNIEATPPPVAPVIAEAPKNAPNPITSPIPNAPKIPTPVTSVAPNTPPPSPNGNDTFLSPLVSSMIQEHHISSEEIATIRGTGLKGRIRKEDINRFLENRKERKENIGTVATSVVPNTPPPPATTLSISSPPPKVPLKSNTPIPPPHSNPDYYDNSFAAIDRKFYQELVDPLHSKEKSVEIIEMSRMRTIIAQHMKNSLTTSAHASLFAEADVTEMVQWRTKNKSKFEQKYSEKITYTPLIIHFLTKALEKFPMLNSSIEGDKIILKKNINIGIATALNSGDLIVPVLKDTDLYTLPQLVKILNSIIAKARSNKLKYNDIEGGTFTLSNIGSFNSLLGTPIIQQPQVAILAIGAIKKKPAVRLCEGQHVIVPRDIMYLSLSFDHRIIDGFLAGSFLNTLTDLLENFAIPEL